jgi:DNA-binding IclR family transcriptional regulator
VISWNGAALPVKPSQSGSRILAALERIARQQPIGVSDLARALEDNLPATQRAIATLAADGWIKAAPGTPTRWVLTSHIHSVAQYARGNHDLRRRAREALEDLRRVTGESVLLNVPEDGKFVVVEVLESPHFLRTTAPIGLIIAPKWSATGRALLPFMTLEVQQRYLGHPADDAMRADFAQTAARGYVISKGDVIRGSTNIAAPIFEAGEPIAAVLVSAPDDRMADSECEALGALVMSTARRLSHGTGTLHLPLS